MNLIQTLEQEAIAELATKKNIPEFRAGDTLKVGVKVIEGDRTRVQNYEGVCIARSGGGLQESFTVRKISYGKTRSTPMSSTMRRTVIVLFTPRPFSAMKTPWKIWMRSLSPPTIL